MAMERLLAIRCIHVYLVVTDCLKEALINSSLNYQRKKKAKCDFAFFFIFNDLSVIENGGASLCRRNSELIRVSLTDC